MQTLWFETLEQIDFETAMAAFQNEADLMVLHSALVRDGVGRYSYLCMRAFATFSYKENQCFWNHTLMDTACPWTFVQNQLQQYQVDKVKDLPPFQGGAVGYWGYELAKTLENLPTSSAERTIPDWILNFYASVLAYDHQQKKLYILSTGFPEKRLEQREREAQLAIEAIKLKLLDYASAPAQKGRTSLIEGEILSNFSQASYQSAVNQVKTHILKGDVFQANFTQRFEAELKPDLNHFDWYQRLCKRNPAPFSALMKFSSSLSLISASPERFLSLTDGDVLAEPIKGTRPRLLDEKEDNQMKISLLESDKDRAENVMIVDLMRSDLSRVCLPQSIKVEALCALHSFKTVHHLISKVKGQLSPKLGPLDVLKATFPPGSVTGAPKRMAMQIIKDLEQIPRGPYCGCFGFISFTGDADTAVTIRTYIAKENKVYFSAGGGIVLDSDAQSEYQESLSKAAALKAVLERG